MKKSRKRGFNTDFVMVSFESSVFAWSHGSIFFRLNYKLCDIAYVSKNKVQKVTTHLSRCGTEVRLFSDTYWYKTDRVMFLSIAFSYKNYSFVNFFLLDLKIEVKTQFLAWDFLTISFFKISFGLYHRLWNGLDLNKSS